jgi:hypothetical protein
MIQHLILTTIVALAVLGAIPSHEIEAQRPAEVPA